MKKHIPEEHQYGFVFHVTDIWSGNKEFKEREKWPLERRLAILDDLVRIPAMFDLPISFGYFNKSLWDNKLFSREPTEVEKDRAMHTVAFAQCCDGIEMFLRECTDQEIAILIAEVRVKVQRELKSFLAIYKNAEAMRKSEFEIGQYNPYERIRESVYFSMKDEARGVQLADVCNFFIRGHLTKHQHNARFYDVLAPVMVWHNKEHDTGGKSDEAVHT